MKENKPKILILIPWFLPGYKAGGPIQSTSNLIKAMGNDYRFSVITLNKDFGSEEPYEEVVSDKWTNFQNIRAYYFSQHKLSYSTLKKLIQTEEFDFLFINSMYSLPFTIWPLWMKLRDVFSAKTVVAPRGMLKANAVKTRALKKKVFLTLVRLTGVHKKIIWQVTNDDEKADVERFFGKNIDIRVAANIPKQDQLDWQSSEKRLGEARMAFTSRVSPHKNIDFFLNRLSNIKGKVLFDIYGPEEDKEYITLCKNIIETLPENITVNFKGAIPSKDLPQILSSYHFSVLTTKSENFGHAIFEGLLAGKPVIISDNTPWKQLESQKIGWEAPLAEPKRFEEIIRQCINMDQTEYDQWSHSAWSFAKSFKESPDLLEKTRIVFS